MSSVVASLAQLWVYPVKSCAGTSVLASALTETGLEWDRAWMVTDAQGRAITQRQLPAMALITTRIRLSDIQLKAPGMLGLHLSMNEVEAPMKVEVWGDTVPAYDMGQLASQWLGDFLGQTERGQQLPAASRVFCGHEVGRRQGLAGPRRKIRQIADRRGDDFQASSPSDLRRLIRGHYNHTPAQLCARASCPRPTRYST